MKRITDAIPKKPASHIMVNIKCDPELYKKLRDKLQKQKITVKDFLVASINVYLSEK